MSPPPVDFPPSDQYGVESVQPAVSEVWHVELQGDLGRVGWQAGGQDAVAGEDGRTTQPERRWMVGKL